MARRYFRQGNSKITVGLRKKGFKMAKLAINGGKPVVKPPLDKSWPIFDEREEKALLEVLHSRHWWRGGVEPSQSKVSQFEDKFASYCQAKHGIAITNGTQALECALKAAGVEAGDVVIVPALTFVATATSIGVWKLLLQSVFQSRIEHVFSEIAISQQNLCKR